MPSYKLDHRSECLTTKDLKATSAASKMSETKLCHVHGFNSKIFLESFFGGSENVFESDNVKFPMQKILSAVTSADINGEMLLDMSLGPIVYQVLPFSNRFKEIVLLRYNDSCIMELKKWLHDDIDAFDWSHASSFMAGLLGESQDWTEKEKQLKLSIKHVLKVDNAKENLTDPIALPVADCVLSSWILDVTSTDEDQYRSTLRKITALVRPGGHLLLVGVLGGTYFTVGEDRMHIFNHNEDFVKNALIDEGWNITDFEVLERTTQNDLSDYTGMLFVAASKNK